MDLGFEVSSVPKAANVVATQLGELEYAPEFGIDKKYFLTSGVNFQVENFRAHVVEKLTENQIAVAEVLILLQALYKNLSFRIDSTGNKVRGFIK